MFEENSWEHEEVVTRLGQRSGLPITVAVHSRALGPAAGGCRLWTYPHWSDGLTDVLRLSRAMTYKCAVAGVPFGGGKSVIAVPSGTALTPSLRSSALADLAELIASFDGSYLAGPDVGTGPDDMAYMQKWTGNVFCLPAAHGGTGPSGAPTAAGVLAALRAGATAVFGSPSMIGKRVVVIGAGSVGSVLVQELSAAGAAVVVSDVDESRRPAGVEWVAPSAALSVEADVIVPAAVGGVLDASTTLRAPLVVGPANNQLVSDSVAATLAARGVVWVPDFVASGGGVIYVLSREFEGLTHEAAMKRVEGIEDTVAALLTSATANGTTPLTEAMTLARTRITRGSLATAG